jgi:hypothetical protein
MAGGFLESHWEKMLPLCCCCLIKGPWQHDHPVLLFLFIWIYVLMAELVLKGCLYQFNFDQILRCEGPR